MFMCLTEMIDEDLGEAFGVVSINGIIYLRLQLSPANPNILSNLLTEHRDTGDTAWPKAPGTALVTEQLLNLTSYPTTGMYMSPRAG